MTKQFLNSEVETKYNKINSDISAMLNKISEIRNSESSEIKNWGHLGDLSRIAKSLEDALFVMGALNEEDFKYNK